MGWQRSFANRWLLLAALAALNLVAGPMVFNRLDFQLMHGWTSAWLWHGVNLYAGESYTDYPPNAIVTLSPIGDDRRITPRRARAVAASSTNVRYCNLESE